MRIFVLAGDPGGGAAVLPVVKALMGSQGNRVVVFAYRQSYQLFSSSGFPCDELPDSFSVGDFEDVLKTAQADVVLSSTSVNGVDLERLLWIASDNLGIPSMALIDFWSNYHKRFENSSGALETLPSKIGVIDHDMFSAMVQSGFPEEKLLVTGQPAFEELPSYTASERAGFKEEVFDRMGIKKEVFLVTFMSQPLRRFYEEFLPESEVSEFNEFVAIDRLLEALDQVFRGGGADEFLVCVKLHPRERSEDWQHLAQRRNLVVVPSDEDSFKYALASNVVVGVTSAILIETALLGCSVYSLQFGSDRKLQFGSFPQIDVCRCLADILKGLSYERGRAGLIRVSPDTPINRGGAVASIVEILQSLTLGK